MIDRGHDQIAIFARTMAHELECNAHKGDPLELTALEHVGELLYHAAKLYMALRFAHREAALEYAADCGNHAWMAAQAAGVLDVAYLTVEAEGGTLIDSDDDYDGALPWQDHYDELKELTHGAFGEQLAQVAAAANAPNPRHALGSTASSGSTDTAGVPPLTADAQLIVAALAAGIGAPRRPRTTGRREAEASAVLTRREHIREAPPEARPRHGEVDHG